VTDTTTMMTMMPQPIAAPYRKYRSWSGSGMKIVVGSSGLYLMSRV